MSTLLCRSPTLLFLSSFGEWADHTSAAGRHHIIVVWPLSETEILSHLKLQPDRVGSCRGTLSTVDPEFFDEKAR